MIMTMFLHNQHKAIRLVAGVLAMLLVAPTATVAGWVVFEGLCGRNISDVGVPMYEYGELARLAGLAVLVFLAASLLVLIYDFARSRAITLFGVLWTLAWSTLYLAGTIFHY
jgi:hypothetical protein